MTTIETVDRAFVVTDASGSHTMNLDGLLHFLSATPKGEHVVVESSGSQWSGPVGTVDGMIRIDFAAHIPYWHQQVNGDSTTTAMCAWARRVGHMMVPTVDHAIGDTPEEHELGRTSGLRWAVWEAVLVMHDLDGSEIDDSPIWQSFEAGNDEAWAYAQERLIDAVGDTLTLADDVELPCTVVGGKKLYAVFEDRRWRVTYAPRLGDNDESYTLEDRFIGYVRNGASLDDIGDDYRRWVTDDRLFVGDRYLARMETNDAVEAWENDELMVQVIGSQWTIVHKPTGDERRATTVDQAREHGRKMTEFRPYTPPARDDRWNNFAPTEGWYDDDEVDDLFPVSGSDHDEDAGDLVWDEDDDGPFLRLPDDDDEFGGGVVLIAGWRDSYDDVMDDPYESVSIRMVRGGDHATVAISDGRARTLASEWHMGQGSALYALSSSGAVMTEALDEIDRCIASLSGPVPPPHDDGYTHNDMERDLRALREYVVFHMGRGPVDGWHTLWEEREEPFDPFDFSTDDGFTIGDQVFEPKFRHTHMVLFHSQRFAAVAVNDGSWMTFDDKNADFYDFHHDFDQMRVTIEALTQEPDDESLKPFVVLVHWNDDDITIAGGDECETVDEATSMANTLNATLATSPVFDELSAHAVALHDVSDVWDWDRVRNLEDAAEALRRIAR